MAVAGTAWGAAASGSEQEARAMLERAIAALKEDQVAALASFTAGAPGFKDKDLYVFCVTPAGVVTANGGHPDHIGLDTHEEIDSQARTTARRSWRPPRRARSTPRPTCIPSPAATRRRSRTR
jgi:hypothetical protein